MTKKLFEQPALSVVNINNKDIIVTSDQYVPMGDAGSANDAEAPDRFRDWY